MPTRRRSTESSEPPASGAEYTPGVLITFKPDGLQAAVTALASSAGIKDVAYAADFDDAAVDMGRVAGAGMTVFNHLGVAVADVDPDQATALGAMDASAIATIEPEPILRALTDGLPASYLAYMRGYRDAVDRLYDYASGEAAGLFAPELAAAAALQDSATHTWGLIATKVADSRLSGRGVRVAVLDTGMDLDHEDFRGRQITSQSFIAGQSAQDENGHGTHCIGTACGPRTPVRGPRYGIAYEAEIFVGKVLSNQGSSLGRSTLAGIEWAVAQGCHVVSMSLGGRVMDGQRHLTAFETVARNALRQNTLIVAAAGNDSRRSQNVLWPVSTPANCPSIMAVAAVTSALAVADFSNQARNPDGKIDIAGPGVGIYSSAPEPAPPPQPPNFRQWPARYETLAGTSMATPHVAGIAALLRQESPTLTAEEIWRVLVSRARPLSAASKDVGAGLVQV